MMINLIQKGFHRRCAAVSSYGNVTSRGNSQMLQFTNAFASKRSISESSVSKRLISMASVRNETERNEARNSSIATELAENQTQPTKPRENWRTQIPSFVILRDTQPYASRLEFLIDSFRKSLLSLPLSDVQDKTKHGFCMITAWLLSDNVIIDLFARVSREHPNLESRLSKIIAIDTLHLFPETLQTSEMMRDKYPEIMKSLHWVKPQKCETRGDFHQIYGQFYDLPESEFDYWTKVEPLQLALKSINGQTSQHEPLIVVTGRRNDQGNQRTSIPSWEKEKLTFNPLVNWRWEDVTLYCQHYGVPVNPLHKRIYIDPFLRFLGKKDRDTYQNFLEATLDYPYFYYQDSVLRQSFSDANNRGNFYVWKSLGDTVTSVPVSTDEAEREGRFVHRHASECGIHTRVVNTKKAPHGGGELVNLINPGDDRSSNNAVALQPGVDYDHVIDLNERQVCDLELLMNGGYSPLKGFMTRVDYESCINDMRLAEGSLWGLPIVLDSPEKKKFKEGQRLLLRSSQMGGDLAIMNVEDVWKPDKMKEALNIFKTTSLDHPYVDYMINSMGMYYIGGSIASGIRHPQRSWLPTPMKVATPAELRAMYRKSPEVLAFQCRNPLHRVHVEMFTQNIDTDGLQVVVHPSIGPSKQDDFDARIRVPTYEILHETLRHHGIDVYYIPYHMRLAGPRETIQHLICRKNYGFTRMIIGRDHAGCKDASGNDFYGPYEAQELAGKYSEELGIVPVPFEQLVYVPKLNLYMQKGEAQSQSLETQSISGTEFRRRINKGLIVPEWYAFPEVVRLLEASFRFHLTGDHELPRRIASIIGQPVVAFHLPTTTSSQSQQARSSAQPPIAATVDAQLSQQIVSLSELYPSVPFFVLTGTAEAEKQIDGKGSVTTIEVITPSKTLPGKSTQTSILGSFEALEINLKKLNA